jgi:acetylornithine deacetylase
VTDWRARVLDAVDVQQDEMVAFLSDLVRRPSISGSDEENSAQQVLAGVFDAEGLDTDHWPIPLAETIAAPGFPGMEVDREEAWGLVGRLSGTGAGPALMLNGHLDVVPPGDLGTWRDADPFSGAVRGGQLFGRGACDMKAGLVAALWAVRALRRSGVPLRGDVVLASVQGEEDGGLGTFATLGRGWRADACVIPEPTSLDLVPANAGSLTFRLLVPAMRRTPPGARPASAPSRSSGWFSAR